MISHIAVDIAIKPSEETIVHAQEVWATGLTVNGRFGLSEGSFKSLKKTPPARRPSAHGTPQIIRHYATSLIDYYLEIHFGNSCKNIMSLFDDGDGFGFLHNHRGEEETDSSSSSSEEEGEVEGDEVESGAEGHIRLTEWMRCPGLLVAGAAPHTLSYSVKRLSQASAPKNLPQRPI